MSTVKISQLPLITQINANTSNTLFVGVDVPTDTTGRMTVTTLANGLYANNILNVGANPVIFPNTAAQFSGSDPLFLQVNQQNFNANGSADYILTADTGTNITNYIDLGINNSQFSNVGYTSMYPLDGYLYVQDGGNAGGNLIVGTASSNTQLNFIVGGTNQSNVVAKMTVSGLSLQNGSNLTFSDGTKQITAGASNAYSQAAFALANLSSSNTVTLQSQTLTLQSNVSSLQSQALVFNSEITSATSNTIITQGVDATQNTNINTVFVIANSAYNTANSAVQNTSNILLPGNVTFNGTVTLNANTLFNGNTIHTGNLYTNGNLVTIGNTTSNGTSTFNGPVIIIGDRTTTGNVINNGNTTFNGLFTNNGNTINNGNTYNNGLTTLNGILSVNGSIIPANSNITLGSANNPFYSIYVSNNGVTLSNSSLSLTGALTVSGNSTLTGALTANGQSNFNGLVIFDNQQYNANVGAVEIIGSSSGLMVPPAANGVMLHLTGLDTQPSKVMNDSFGSGNTYSLFVGRAGRGTAASPLPTQSGDIIARFSGSSYGGPNTGFLSTSTGRMDVIAIENHSDTNRGTMISFSMPAVGSNVITTNVVTIATNTMNISATTTLNVANVIVANTYAFSNTSNTGVVTQQTSKSTSVTANGTFGQIIMNSAQLTHATEVVFTVNNSYVQHVGDIPMVVIQNPVTAGQYLASIAAVRVGSFDIMVSNLGAGPAQDKSDAIVLNWALMRVGS